MLKIKFISFLAAILMLSTMLSSCNYISAKLQGEQGIQGVPGQNGLDGKDGVNGKDGASLLSGRGVPADDLGKAQDSYIDLDTWDFYVKNENKWILQSNLKTNQDNIEELKIIIEDLKNQLAASEEKSPTCINNTDLTLLGKASIDENNVVTVGGGSENKALLNGGFQSNHFSMFAKFKILEGDNFSFVIGKGGSYYGFWIELVNRDEKSYLNIYKDLLGNVNASPSISCELDFTLESNKEYLVQLTFDTLVEESPRKEMRVEIFGESNEYYTYTTNCNAYGVPFYYSNSTTCLVSSYSLSINHYYDIENAKVAIFGHSFVEGDSLGIQRSQGFAYLLEDYFGEGKILNFGLGGDAISAMSNKISNSERFIKNCDYALLCIGTNDRGLNSENFISKLKECISKLEKIGVTPILFTIPHTNYEMTDDMIRINNWIRSSGYYYVDMYKVFANSDGTCKTELFMSDKIHPTIEGHSYIYNRIKLDCPFLF